MNLTERCIRFVKKICSPCNAWDVAPSTLTTD